MLIKRMTDLSLSFTRENLKDKKPLVLSISGNQYGPVSFTGVLYAPYADVEIDMGYDCEFIGSIYAQTLDVNSPGISLYVQGYFQWILIWERYGSL